MKSFSLQLFLNFYDPTNPTNITPNYESMDKWSHFYFPISRLFSQILWKTEIVFSKLENRNITIRNTFMDFLSCITEYPSLTIP